VPLEAVPREILLAIAIVALALATLASARRWLAGRRLRARASRAAVGESEAARLLEDHGYVIEGAQVASRYALEVDGERIDVPLRADYVVRRGRDRLVAEVKTGAIAPSIRTIATRRQLLEYLVGFDVDGVLLVDADRRTLRRVAFRPDRPAARAHGARGGGLATTLAVAVLALALLALTLALPRSGGGTYFRDLVGWSAG